MSAAKRPKGLCRSCGAAGGTHRLTCRFNRCACGAPATVGSQCGPCYFKARKEAQHAERQRIIAERLDRLGPRRDD